MKDIPLDVARLTFTCNSEPNEFFGDRRTLISGRGQPESYLQVLNDAGVIVSVTVRHSGKVQTYWVEL